MQKFKLGFIFIAALELLCACKSKSNRNYNYNQVYYFKKGSFGYDLDFLKKKDSVVLLKSSDGLSEVIVSPKYQGKVFTSTANGDEGKSFGWINYKAFGKAVDPHMNAYGGEDRLWIGPEGGKFALFFKQGTKMEFANWFTPAPMDHESWTVIGKEDKQVSLTKSMSLVNYLGTRLDIEVNRQIGIMSEMEIEKALGIQLDTTVKTVGIKTNNIITNASSKAWTKQTGAPCLWDLDMFTPSPQVTIVIPYKVDAKGKVATTDYFGQIPPTRVNYKNGHLFFKADGKSRGKLGMPAARSTSIAGSYDATNNVLTITKFDVDSRATYLNQEWKTDKDPLAGDAVNAYNDGPLADGTQMGPFYEIESVSPGAFLKPGEKLMHKHCIFHFTGNKSSLNLIAIKTLGVSLSDIQSAL
ncbi:DUF6786 family protein [Mucilaginibacter sp. McL0603]|uniref:DUF6786 family protein n=1 Tax=Mucilaginibacter sp. McL0603 TaxID=3415670 RepID=UPI003CE90F64